MHFITFILVFLLFSLLLLTLNSFVIFYGGTFVYFYWYMGYEWQMAYAMTKERMTWKWFATIIQYSNVVIVPIICSTSLFKEFVQRLQSYYVPEELSIEGYIGDYYEM